MACGIAWDEQILTSDWHLLSNWTFCVLVNPNPTSEISTPGMGKSLSTHRWTVHSLFQSRYVMWKPCWKWQQSWREQWQPKGRPKIYIQLLVLYH